MDSLKYCKAGRISDISVKRKLLNDHRLYKRTKIWEDRRGDTCEGYDHQPGDDNGNQTLHAGQKKLTRTEKLQQWKKERLEKKKLEQAKKIQPFKVGIIQRKTNYPLTNVTNKLTNGHILNPKVVKKTETKIDMKAKNIEKLSDLKIENNSHSVNPASFVRVANDKRKHIEKHSVVVSEVVPKQLTTLQDSIRSNYLAISTSRTVENSSRAPVVENTVSLASPHAETTPETGETCVPAVSKMSDCDHISKSPLAAPQTPLALAMEVDDKFEERHKELDSEIESFRNYVYCETERLLRKCEDWYEIKRKIINLPAEIQGDIDCVTGKTKLLTSDKFKQFKDLIEKCEKGDPMIKVQDLKGFQDWVSIEVNRVDDTFQKLEQKQSEGWKEEKKKIKKMNKLEVKNFKPNRNPVKQKAGSSILRAHIQAARKSVKKNIDDFSHLCPPNTSSSGRVSPRKSTPKKRQSFFSNLLYTETRKLFQDLAVPVVKNKEVSPCQKRKNSGIEILKATQNAKSLTPKKSPYRSTFGQSLLFVTLTPLRTSTPLKESESNSVDKNIDGLDEKYFQPLPDQRTPNQVNDSEFHLDVFGERGTDSARKRDWLEAVPSRKSARLKNQKYGAVCAHCCS